MNFGRLACAVALSILSLTGCAGEDGTDGARGADGDRGPAGEQGLTGPEGPAGERGPAGEPGASATAPASGQDDASEAMKTALSDGNGASGGTVLKLMSFEASVGLLELPGFSGNTIITPVACRAPGYYIAGPNEVAVISMSATASPTFQDTNLLYLSPMISNVGINGPFKRTLAANVDHAESLMDGTAHVSVSDILPLTEGMSYVFGAGLSANSKTKLNPAYCTGTIMILKMP